MTEAEEQIRISRVIAGDVQAFAALVEAYKDRAVLLAYNILLSQEDAEEVAQDAFVKAYTALPSFKADARFATWLYRIVVNTALNKKKVKRPYWQELTGTLEELPPGNAAPRLPTVTREHQKHIQKALQTLGMKERLCITLHYLHELSVEEIHEGTQLSVANIKVLLHRGRKNLYAALHRELKGEIIHLKER